MVASSATPWSILDEGEVEDIMKVKMEKEEEEVKEEGVTCGGCLPRRWRFLPPWPPPGGRGAGGDSGAHGRGLEVEEQESEEEELEEQEEQQEVEEQEELQEELWEERTSRRRSRPER